MAVTTSSIAAKLSLLQKTIAASAVKVNVPLKLNPIAVDGVASLKEQLAGIVVSGTTMPKAKLEITFGDGSVVTTTASATGSFAVKLAGNNLPSTSGSLPLKVTATTITGDKATSSASVLVDKVPALTLLSGTDAGVIDGIPGVRVGNSISGAKFQLSLDGKTWVDNSALLKPQDGANVLQVRQLVGNQPSDPVQIKFTEDKTAPVVTLTGSTKTELASLTGTVHDANLKSITILDGATVVGTIQPGAIKDGAWSWTATTKLGGGVHSLSAVAEDMVGHKTTITADSFSLGFGLAGTTAYSLPVSVSNGQVTGSPIQREVNALVGTHGYKWAPSSDGVVHLTYKVLPGGVATEDGMTWTLSATQKEALSAALGSWAKVANIEFTQVSASAESNLTIEGVPLKGNGQVAADATLPVSWDNHSTLRLYAEQQGSTNLAGMTSVLTHEVGHLLGLKHDFETDTASGSVALPSSLDTSINTVMSYTHGYFYLVGNTYVQADTGLGIGDIAAAQALYGANRQVTASNDNYRFTDASNGLLTIWDGGGTDTLDASQQTRAVVLNLIEGMHSSVGTTIYDYTKQQSVMPIVQAPLTIAMGAVIENATGGSGHDILIGNDVGNLLVGNKGNDVFVGSLGLDTIQGGEGLDMLKVLLDVAGAVTLQKETAALWHIKVAGVSVLDVAQTATGFSCTGVGSANDCLGTTMLTQVEQLKLIGLTGVETTFQLDAAGLHP